MRTAKVNLTKEELDKELKYNPETGQFFWRTSGKGRNFWSEAGTISNHGYRQITIKYERFVAHRLAWLTTYGEFPKMELDHIDGNKLNNRISNLREVTHSQNLFAAPTRTDNTSGVRGVCWDAQHNRWKVQVGPAKKRVQKLFYSFAEAKAFAQNYLLGQTHAIGLLAGPKTACTDGLAAESSTAESRLSAD